MTVYYLDRHPQNNGEYQLHEDGCTQLPLPSDRTYLGTFQSLDAAIQKASRIHHRCRPCAMCCEPVKV